MSLAMVCIALGANLGARAQTLRAAVDLLGQTLRVTAMSHWIETPAVGGPAQQPPFLNGVLLAQTSLSAHDVLHLCLQTELALGRDRSPDAVRWGPRAIDLDLLLYDQLVVDYTPDLLLPHPRMHQRRFVLQPLCEIAPELRHPTLGMTIRELSAALP